MIISYKKLKLPVRSMAYSRDFEAEAEFLRSSSKAPTRLIFGMYSTKNDVISSSLKNLPQNCQVKPIYFICINFSGIFPVWGLCYTKIGSVNRRKLFIPMDTFRIIMALNVCLNLSEQKTRCMYYWYTLTHLFKSFVLLRLTLVLSAGVIFVWVYEKGFS